MSRMQPYRQKIPVHIIQLLDVASRITLFLVGQSGPLCFTFKDRLDQKYKTSIGCEIKCTCSPNRNDHCIHSMYILLKIFKIAVTNSIIWQAAYVDSELQDFATGKHSTAVVRISRPVFEMEDLQLPSEYLRNKEYLKDLSKFTQEPTTRMTIDSQSSCPICQQKITQDLCITYCKVQCGNNFHLECMKIWAQHKIHEETSISCPMCRCKLSGNYLRELEHEERDFNKKEMEKITVKYKCAGCGLNEIPSNVHKCLLCTSYQLCAACYVSNKHIKHPFIRKGGDARWRGAEERRESQLKIKSFIESKSKETTNQQLLLKLRKIQEDPGKINDFICSAYPYVSKYISENIDPYKKMDFNMSDMKCLRCGSTKMLFLRRLTCGHFIDHECLKDHLLKEKYYCDHDGTKILKGYENMLQRERHLSQEKIRHMDVSAVESQFKVDHIEITSILHEQTNEEDHQIQPTLAEILTDRNQRSRSRIAQHEHLVNRLQSHIVRHPVAITSETNKDNHQARQVRIRSIPNRSNVSNSKQKDTSAQTKDKNRLDRHQMMEALIGRKIYN